MGKHILCKSRAIEPAWRRTAPDVWRTKELLCIADNGVRIRRHQCRLLLLNVLRVALLLLGCLRRCLNGLDIGLRQLDLTLEQPLLLLTALDVSLNHC